MVEVNKVALTHGINVFVIRFGEDAYFNFVAGPELKSYAKDVVKICFFTTPNLSRHIRSKFKKPTTVGEYHVEVFDDILDSKRKEFSIFSGREYLSLKGFPKSITAELSARLDFVCFSHFANLWKKKSLASEPLFFGKGGFPKITLAEKLAELQKTFSHKDFDFRMRSRIAHQVRQKKEETKRFLKRGFEKRL